MVNNHKHINAPAQATTSSLSKLDEHKPCDQANIDTHK